jgi:hypothetical protein
MEFDVAIKQKYEKEYLQLPDENDLKSITKLHKSVHEFDGMIGSLDCMHAVWKNCPIAWQGSFKGGIGKNALLCSRQSVIIISGFGMRLLDMQELRMISIF